MTNLGKNIQTLFDALNSSLEQILEGAVKANEDRIACDHGVGFDEERAALMDSYEIQRVYPRLNGTCPKGCGYVGIAYASAKHYYAGDW